MGIGAKRRAAVARRVGAAAPRIHGPVQGRPGPAPATLGGIPRPARCLAVLAGPAEPPARSAALSSNERTMGPRATRAIARLVLVPPTQGAFMFRTVIAACVVAVLAVPALAEDKGDSKVTGPLSFTLKDIKGNPV